MAVIQKTIGAGGDYAGIGAAWKDLPATLNDDYEFEVISDFTETQKTGGWDDRVLLNNHYVKFYDTENHTITNNGFNYIFTNASSLAPSSTVILDGLKIVQTSGLTPFGADGVIQFNVESVPSNKNFCAVLKNIELSGFVTAQPNSGIVYNLGAIKISMFNCKIYGFNMGISVFNYNMFSYLSLPNSIQNCSLRSNKYGINFFQVNGTTAEKYIDFKNVVVCNSITKDWRDEGPNPQTLHTFTNCADSDNSISLLPGILSDNITGITDADFSSVNPIDDNFLKIDQSGDFVASDTIVSISENVTFSALVSSASKLFQTGTTSIFPSNTEDLAGNQRPDQNGKVSIGCYERNEIVAWNWNLDDGKTSTQENPVVSYDTPGLKDISVMVTYADGTTDTIVKTDYIEVKGYVFDFTGEPIAGPTELKVQFNHSFTPEP